MKYLFLLMTVFCFHLMAAQGPFNQILFSESAQSWTARDFILFEKIKNEILNQKRISQFSENQEEDFLISRLTAREAVLFEVTAVEIKLSEVQKKNLLNEFSLSEIKSELNQISLAKALIELKEVQLKQKLRFKTWFDLLKRKYNVKFKSSDFKI